MSAVAAAEATPAGGHAGSAQHPSFSFTELDSKSGREQGVKMQLKQNATPLTWENVISLWTDNPEFGILFSQKLAGVAIKDFFWECTPVSGMTAKSQPFECVVLDACGSLSRRQADRSDFDEHFASHEGPETAIRFPNLGKDAMMIVPVPVKGIQHGTYNSLASFVRGAPAQQQAELWSALGEELLEQLHADDKRPLWPGTDGRAVPWLHVRLDTKPKYTKYSAYHQPPKATQNNSTNLETCRMGEGDKKVRK